MATPRASRTVSSKGIRSLLLGFAPILTVYILGIVLAFAVGWKMETPYAYYQFLGREHLTNRLGESMLYLHSQPPALNFLLGLALKLESSLSLATRWTLLALNLVIGCGIVVTLLCLLDRLNMARWQRHVVAALVFLNPAFYFYLLGFFYPIFEMFYLILIGALIGRFFATPSAAVYALLCIVTTTLAYTRSLFHFSWALLLLLFVAIVGARRQVSAPATNRRCRILFVLAILVILGWPAKNYFIFGTFSFSSWQGLNFSQGLSIGPGPWSQMFSFGTSPASLKQREEAIHSVPRRFRDIPVLAEPVKTKGVPNWNHYVMLEHSRGLGRRALEKLHQEPALALQKAAKNYSRSYTISASRDPRSGEYIRRSTSLVALWWQRAYEILVFQFFGQNSQSGRINGFAVIFPIVILLTGVKLIRTWNHNLLTSPLIAYFLFSILWVLAMTLGVDGVEANRMRFATQPFIFICAVWALGGREK